MFTCTRLGRAASFSTRLSLSELACFPSGIFVGPFGFLSFSTDGAFSVAATQAGDFFAGIVIKLVEIEVKEFEEMCADKPLITILHFDLRFQQ